jgi:hypothetical protein
MKPTSFGDNPMPRQTRSAEPDLPDLPPSQGGNKGQAVAHLLRHQELISQLGDYEVRTTLDTYRAWRYRCSIWRRGRELRRTFVPIVVDRTRHVRTDDLITEEMRIQFAMEAVDLHMTRWAALQKHLAQSPDPDYVPTRRRYDGILSAALVIAVGVSLLVGYWLWSQRHTATPEPPAVESPAPTVRWEQDQVSYALPAGKRFALLLPALENLSESVPVAVTIDVSGQRPNWLHFFLTTLVISGTAPTHAAGRTFHVIFHARPERGNASPLHVYLTITK